MLLRLTLAAAAVLILLLLAGWLFTLRHVRVAEARHPPAGQFADVEGFRLHFTDEGSGPAIVLIHGAGANLLDFAPLVPQLAEALRVLRVDRPGSGYSGLAGDGWPDPATQARAILALLAERGVARAVWVGHSWGGAVVMAGLLAAPERVRGGVLLAGAAYPWAGGVDLTDRLPGWPLLGPLFSHTLVAPLGRLLLDRGIAGVFAPNDPTLGYARSTGVGLYLRPSHFAASARDIRRLSPYLEQQAPHYALIEQPLLLIHGTADTIVPAWNHTDRLQRLLPQAEVLRLPDTGHALHHVHPGAIAARLVAFSHRSLGAASVAPGATSRARRAPPTIASRSDERR